MDEFLYLCVGGSVIGKLSNASNFSSCFPADDTEG